MNSNIKGIVLLAAAGAALLFGIKNKLDKELEALKKSEAAALVEKAESAKRLEMLSAKLELEKTEGKAGTVFEEKYLKSNDVIATERKRITDIKAKWSQIDAERVSAVKAVREKEASRPPAALTLVDGTKLSNCIIRSVPDEKTVSVEHLGGVVKIGVEKLPADVKARLGLGWRVEAPAALDFDAKGNVVAVQAPESDGGPNISEPLNLDTLDLSNVAAMVRSLALVESHLAKTLGAVQREKAMARKHAMFKQDMIAAGTGKTYRELRDECILRQASLSSRVEALKAVRGSLQQKLKSS